MIKGEGGYNGAVTEIGRKGGKGIVKNRNQRAAVVVLIVCMVFFAALESVGGFRTGCRNEGGGALQSAAAVLGNDTCAERLGEGFRAGGCGYAGQRMDGGDSLRTGSLDFMPASEAKDTVFMRGGRMDEDSAEPSLFFVEVFLILSVFQFLLDGRMWSAVQSFCMGFQNYAMLQVHIIQQWDGKKGRLSYSFS